MLMTKSEIQSQALDMAIGQIVRDATPVLFKMRSWKTCACGEEGGHIRQMLEGVVAGELKLLRQVAYFNGVFLDRLSTQYPEREDKWQPGKMVP